MLCSGAASRGQAQCADVFSEQRRRDGAVIYTLPPLRTTHTGSLIILAATTAASGIDNG